MEGLISFLVSSILLSFFFLLFFYILPFDSSVAQDDFFPPLEVFPFVPERNNITYARELLYSKTSHCNTGKENLGKRFPDISFNLSAINYE